MSLIEIVIAVGLISVLALMTTQLLTRSMAFYRSSQQNLKLQEKTARVMREFEFSTRAADSVATANDTELAFYRYYDLTSISPTLVRYFIEGDTFKVGKTLPVGNPPSVAYPPENEKIEFLIDNLANQTKIFTYYNGDNVLLSQPVTISDVKLIGLDISLDIDPAKSPVPITESTKVNLRNMKKNL